MTDVTTDSSQHDAAAEEWADGEPVQAVHDLFVTLGKAFRAYQLYDENNPVRQRFVESLRQAFQGLWQELGQLKLVVEEDRILFAGQAVYTAETRADSLAFLFFKDGIREITFLPGLEDKELEPFLGVLQRARKLRPEGDDLLTVLWEEDLQYFLYQYVDYLAEGVELPVAGGGNSADELTTVLAEEVPQEEDQEAEEEGPSRAAAEARQGPQTVNKEDFNPTLYSLDPREMQTLRVEIEREAQRDLRSDVLAALFDRLEEPELPERQSEILGILSTLLPNFLSRGALVAATNVLEELRRLESTAGVFDTERLERSQGILDEVSAPETIGELIQALYDGTIRATPQQLANFLQYLRSGALAPLLRASETVEHKELQAVLRKAVQGIASRNRTAVVQLLDESDPVVASGAARLCGDMQISEAGPALANLLAHPDASVRLAAVEAAVSLKASTAAGALQETLDDPDRKVRIAAARALGELRYRPAARRLSQIVAGKDIRNADISEKVAFFEAYGRVAAEGAVRLMDKLLNGKGFLGKREPGEVRAAAALALGKVSGEAARAALDKAASDEDAVVRSAVSRALRREE